MFKYQLIPFLHTKVIRNLLSDKGEVVTVQDNELKRLEFAV